MGVFQTSNRQSTHFSALFILDPGNDKARELLVRNLTDVSRYQDAMPLVNDLIQHSPKKAEYLYLRGMIYRGEGRFQPAIIDLEKASASPTR